MIPVSTEYIQSIYGDVRQFKSRIRIDMNNEDYIFNDNWNFDYKGKVRADDPYPPQQSVIVQRQVTGEIVHWDNFIGFPEVSQSAYDVIAQENEGGVYHTETITLNAKNYHFFSFDMIDVLTQHYGESIWEGKTLLADRVARAKDIIKRMSIHWLGRGHSNAGYKATLTPWNAGASYWDQTNQVISWDSTLDWITIPIYSDNPNTELIPSNMIETDGRLHVMAFSESADGIVPSYLETDYIYLEMEAYSRAYDDQTIVRMNIIEEISILSETLPSNELQLTLSNESGDFNFLDLQNMFKILASKPKVWVELGLIKEDESVEWIPCGMWFISSWQNDQTSKIITLTANDYLGILSDISYTPVGITNLYDLAKDVLTKGGIPEEDQIVDINLQGYTVRGFPEIIDSRTALQHIGMVSRAAVGQDRYGNVFIKRFLSIDQETNFLNYPTTQPSLFGYPNNNNQLLNNTESGMKRIALIHMYSPPTITLEKSIYQLKIKVYTTNEGVEYIYTNAVIEGTNGQSFSIDNPLINTIDLADDVVTWYMREINYNAVYSVDWRQNPALESTDLILIEDSFGNEKQSRITRQEFTYEGYLMGRTETRGGV